MCFSVCLCVLKELLNETCWFILAFLDGVFVVRFLSWVYCLGTSMMLMRFFFICSVGKTLFPLLRNKKPLVDYIVNIKTQNQRENFILNCQFWLLSLIKFLNGNFRIFFPVRCRTMTSNKQVDWVFKLIAFFYVFPNTLLL